MSYQSAGKGNADPMTSFYFSQKKILEINPHHPLMKKLLERVEKKDIDSLKSLAPALYEIYLVASGYEPQSTTLYADRIETLVRAFVGVDASEKAGQEHIVKAKNAKKQAKAVKDDIESEEHDEL